MQCGGCASGKMHRAVFLRRCIGLAAVICMLLALGGCTMAGVGELYALPQLSGDSVQLESLIAERINSGSEYAAPTEGSRRQSVQMQDMTGDGIDEAVAFLADETHTPTVCIYTRDAQQNYYLYVVIRGEGSSVCAVEYADLTGNGVQELIITWAISSELRLLTVYTLADGAPQQLLSADSYAFCAADLTGDGKEDLINLRSSGGFVVDCCSFAADGGSISCSAQLSDNIQSVERMRTAPLADGSQALYVESVCDDGNLVTDVLAAPGGAIANLTMTASGCSDTVRSSPAYAVDINGDGMFEIPYESGELLVWYDIDSAGQRSQVMTTYHNYDDGWYMVLDGFDVSALAIETGSVVAGSDYVIFYEQGADGSRTELLAVYTLTGENRLDRAALEGRFVLAQTDTVIYAAVLKTDNRTQQDIINSFRLIYTEWQTGQL